jgi:hypothetical protein
LNDALNSSISTCLKLMGKIKHLPMLDALVDDDDYGLNIKFWKLLQITLRRKSLVLLIFSFPSWQHMMKEEPKKMLALMLDIKFNGLRLISSFIGRGNICFLCSWNLIVICIHCLRLKVSLFTKLMKIVAWTFSKWWPTLVNLQRN